MEKRSKQKIEVPSMEAILTERERLKHKKRYREAFGGIIYTLIAVEAIAVLVAMLWMPFLRIYGSSMSPTLKDGEIVCCVKTSDYAPGDIISFYYNNKILVKRVIGLSGDWIDIDEEGNVYVNEVRLDEPYLEQKALGECDIKLPYQVPEGKIFVMGDQRSLSIDSRNTAVGCVSQEMIVGKGIFRLWPLARLGIL